MRPSPFSLLAVSLLAIACAKKPEAPPPTPAPPTTASQQPETQAPSGKKSCESSADCAGATCIGPQGCDAIWVCEDGVACTRDFVPYCGCDGKTFFGSSTCPPRKYSHEGSCDTDEHAEAQPLRCSSNADCPSDQMCQGPAGCDQPWTCGPARPCRRDLVTYCGCDGKTFQGSSNCPLRPYSQRGPCP